MMRIRRPQGYRPAFAPRQLGTTIVANTPEGIPKGTVKNYCMELASSPGVVCCQNIDGDQGKCPSGWTQVDSSFANVTLRYTEGGRAVIHAGPPATDLSDPFPLPGATRAAEEDKAKAANAEAEAKKRAAATKSARKGASPGGGGAPAPGMDETTKMVLAGAAAVGLGLLAWMLVKPRAAASTTALAAVPVPVPAPVATPAPAAAVPVPA